jgi:hypothetical protein
MSEILNCSINPIAPTGNIMFYIGTAAVLLSIFYMLVWASVCMKGIRKNIIWNESYSSSVKNLLPLFIRNGFLMIFSGLTIGALLLFQGWDKALLLIPAVLFLFGLTVLFVAWHIRQGLLYGRFVRLAIELRNIRRSIHRLFLFQLFFWMVLFVCWIKYHDHQSIVAGSTFLIVILSFVFILKLKKSRK